MANQLLQAFPDGTKTVTDIRRYLAEGFILIKTDAEEVLLEDYSNTPYQAIYYNGSIFKYDENDTTTAHDGLTCLKSVDNRRYKIEPQSIIKASVDSISITSQPSSPNLGDAYLLPVAPSGDEWASKAKHIAIYTARSWVFIPPIMGMICYVGDEDSYYRYTNTGAWVQGLGELGLANGGVKTSSLQNPFGYKVQSILNDPPNIPGAGVAYIIGTTPNADWGGKQNQIAESEGILWKYFTPNEGDQVFNIATQSQTKFASGVWVTSTKQVYLHDVKLYNIKDKPASFTGGVVMSVLYSGNVGDVVDFSGMRFKYNVPDPGWNHIAVLRRGGAIIEEASEFSSTEVILNWKGFFTILDNTEHIFDITTKSISSISSLKFSATGVISIWRGKTIITS